MILDIGQYEPGSKIEKDIDTGKKITFYYTNALSSKQYTVSINKKIKIPTPFVLEGTQGDPKEGCETILTNFLGDYPSLTEEKEIYKQKKEILDKLKECDASYKEQVENLAKVKIDENLEVLKDEEYWITISREGATWTFVFKGPSSGDWGVYYGFTFAIDLKERDTYFTKENSDDTFTITKQEDRENRINYYPTVGYQWQKNSKKNFTYAFQGGLGSNLEEVVVMLGVSAIYHYNLSLSAGVILHKIQFLKGKYKENEIVDDNLDFDQLHDYHYRPNLGISLNFRFAENPFKKAAE